MNSLILGLFLLASGTSVLAEFQLYDQWSSVDFDYDQQQKSDDIKNSRLRPEEVVVYSAELYVSGPNETLFVTTPNLFGAAPFSLSTVSNKNASDGSSLLKPYPDETYYKGDCNDSIISVFRVKVDKFNRLWVVDSGMVNQQTANSSLICPPKILIFNLTNNQLIKKFKIPDGQHYDDSLLVNIELHYNNDDGSDVTAFLADVTGYRMVVYNLKEDSSYPIDNPYFNPFPLYCFYKNINGKSFTLLRGLYTISISPPLNSYDKKFPNTNESGVYFHGLSSARMGFTFLSILTDPKESQNAFSYSVYPDVGFHSTIQVMTSNGFLIFTNLEKNSIMVWDTAKPYKLKNFRTIAKDDVRFQFITGMQLLDDNKLLITSSRYQNVITKDIKKNEINYRVLINLDISKYLKR